MAQTFVGVPSCYPQLVQLRKSKDAAFKPNRFLKETTKLRYYQVVGSLHMLMLERMVLGDATGIGKTLEMIATYSFLLDKDPGLKLLVVCQKSALDQWAEEFDKFTTGIGVRVIKNEFGTLKSHEARTAQYKLFKENVLVMNYAPLLDEYEEIRATLGSNYMICFDECFDYHTPVTLEDGTTELIGKIVSKKMDVKVLSYNFETHKVEAKKVINFFKTPATSWLQVKGKRTNTAICSPVHNFYTTNGKEQAQNLDHTRKIYGLDRVYTDEQRQIILGSLLGDGSLTQTKNFRKGKDTGTRLMQSARRMDYLMFKATILAYHLERISKQKSGWNKFPMWTLHTFSSPILTDLLRKIEIISKTGRKQITRKWLDELSPIGLAIWYCDDGSLGRPSISMSTHCFTKKENELIIKYFKERWGINFKISKDKKKKLYSLYALKEDSEKFLEIVSPYIPESMSYKSDRPCGDFWKKYTPKKLNWDIFEDDLDYVKSIHLSHTNKSAKFKYNIEVEDNHNFFAGGMLVSNCVAFKNKKTQTHFACKFLADQARRVYGLSATIIKNGLEEVYCIYDVVVPGVFGRITKFKDTFFKQKLIKIRQNGKDRYFPKVIGYKNLEQFKNTIDPYFLIRKKQDVASELPKLISRKVMLEMLPRQRDLYRQALVGILYEERLKQDYFQISDQVRLGSTDPDVLKKYADLKDKYDKFLTTDGKKRGKLAALTYCQMISNGPALINEVGESSKEEEFIRLMKDELLTEKVILFTRFKSGIPTLEVICERNGIPYVKITGDQNDRERQQARTTFQTDPNCRLIFITTAGSASLNLQSASAIIFYDTPWSYGDLVQTIGRAQRIGSIQDHILIIHFVNKGTIDMRVINKVTDKKDLSDQILGDTAEGALDFTSHEDSAVDALYTDLLKDAENF
jgi:superfamily II DNA or RNA helicase